MIQNKHQDDQGTNYNFHHNHVYNPLFFVNHQGNDNNVCEGDHNNHNDAKPT